MSSLQNTRDPNPSLTSSNNSLSLIFPEDDEIEIADSTTQLKNENPNGKNRWSFLSKISHFFQRIGSLFTFRFAIQQRPISFFRPEDHNSSGRKDTSHNPDEIDPDILEVKVNFRDEMFERYRELIEERLEVIAMKSNERLEQFDLSKYPGWDRQAIFRLRSLFQIFDIGGDGLTSFNEFCETLDEYGDQTPEDERKFYFDKADTQELGAIDFAGFLSLMHNLTMKSAGGAPRFKSGELKAKGMGMMGKVPAAESDKDEILKLTQLGTSLRQIDRNLTRIKSLDVVQQLQAGLF